MLTDAGDLQSLCETLARGDVIAVDTETTGLDPRAGKLRLLTLATQAGCWIVDCFRVDPTPILRVLAGKFLVMHHAAFDLGFLAAAGFTPQPVADTCLLSRLLHAGERVAHGLGEVVCRELGETLPKELQRSDWSGPLTEAQYQYAASDARILLPLWQKLAAAAEAAGLKEAWRIEARCLPAIVWMSLSGVPFDAARWEALTTSAAAEAAEIAAEMDAAVPSPGLGLGTGWRWGSPQDVLHAFRGVGVALADTTDETLAACHHPLACLLRRHREAVKRAGSFGRNWLQHAEDGRLHPDWKQMGSEAGRMSCSSPNVQQVPRDSRYRACIAAPEGRLLVKADYSQIELRIAACITQDRRMLAAYQAGEDIHTLTARQVTGQGEVTKEARQLAKAINFGLLYGMGANGFRAYAGTQFGVALTPQEAAQYREAFFHTYEGIWRWHRQVRRGRATETRTLTGRRRLLDARTPDPIRLNSPVQGTGADGLKRALALLWERRQQCPGAFPVLAVHDEIVVECAAEQSEAAAAWLRQAMLDGMQPLLAGVPVLVETTTGRTWAGS